MAGRAQTTKIRGLSQEAEGSRRSTRMNHLQRLSLCAPALFLAPLLTANGSSLDTEGRTRQDALALAKGQGAFALETHQRLAALTRGNMVWSPASVHAALLSLQAGARGSSLSSLSAALHLPDRDIQRWQVAQSHLLRSFLCEEGSQGALSLADAIWTTGSMPFNSDTLDTLHSIRGAQVHPVDFTDPQTLTLINEWVSEKTRGMIPSILHELPSGPMLLTNALYFASSWESQFTVSRTDESPFTLQSGEVIETTTMHGWHSAHFFSNELLTLAEVSFERNGTSLLLILPKEGLTLGDLQEHLVPKNLAKWLDQANSVDLRLDMPRLDVHTKGLPLRSALNSAGLSELFDQRADLTGFADPVGGLYLADVLHGCRLTLNETGIEAAAATLLPAQVGSAPHVAVPPRRELSLDRPFMFMARENRSGSVLLMGRIDDPRTPEPTQDK